MAKRSATKVQEYIDALDDLAAMRRQLAADATLASKPRWAEMYRDALVTVRSLHQTLTGGELGKARRMLVERAARAQHVCTPACDEEDDHEP